MDTAVFDVLTADGSSSVSNFVDTRTVLVGFAGEAAAAAVILASEAADDCADSASFKTVLLSVVFAAVCGAAGDDECEGDECSSPNTAVAISSDEDSPILLAGRAAPFLAFLPNSDFINTVFPMVRFLMPTVGL